MKILIPVTATLIIAAILTWIFYMVRKESRKLTIRTIGDLNNSIIQKLKCPKCGVHAVTGYTIAGRGVLFRNKDEAFKLITPGNLIPNTANLGFSTKYNLAWKCTNCKLLIIDYSCQIKN